MTERNCARCQEDSPDMRTIAVSCDAMLDGNVPFELMENGQLDMCAMLLCRKCRISFCHAIELWFARKDT